MVGKINDHFKSYKDFYDLIFKTLGIIGAIIVFYDGLNKFNKTIHLSYQFELYKMKAEVLYKILTTTGGICKYEKDGELYKIANQEFDNLITTQIYLIENDKLENLLKRFYTIKIHYNNGDESVIKDLQKLSEQISTESIKVIKSLTENVET